MLQLCSSVRYIWGAGRAGRSAVSPAMRVAVSLLALALVCQAAATPLQEDSLDTAADTPASRLTLLYAAAMKKPVSHRTRAKDADEYETIFISVCMLFKVCFSALLILYLCLCNLKWTFFI